MPKISIKLPPLDAEDTVEVTVVVNGKSRKYDYRMELFAWEEHAEPHEQRVMCLKRIVENYDEDWSLVEIGEPSEHKKCDPQKKTRGIYPIRTPRIGSVKCEV